jgi:hypothetical protein
MICVATFATARVQPVFRLLVFAIALATALLAPPAARAQEAATLTVQDPQSWWRSGRGTMTEAELTIRPKGMFALHELTMSFASKGNGLEARKDTLEVTMNFTLPEQAIIVDSWLWLDDDKTIIRAALLDRWTASTIYENIVRRRRDPSILFKNSPTSYSLSIFPMAGDRFRRVRLSYILPATLDKNGTSSLVTLPTGLLRSSATVPSLRVNVVGEATQSTTLNASGTSGSEASASRAPRIVEAPTQIKFTSFLDSLAGNQGGLSTQSSTAQRQMVHTTTIPAATLQSASRLTLATNAPMRNGIYVSNFSNGKDAFYSVTIAPGQITDLSQPKKVAIALEYDATRALFTRAQMLEQIRQQLLATFNPRDSFNIIFSQLSSVRRASQTWLRADSATIERTVAAINADAISGYANLPALLADGIGFVKSSGNDGAILLMANSTQYGLSVIANQLLRDLQTVAAGKLPPINIFDFNTIFSNYQFLNGTVYYGNEYFYDNLTRSSGGYYSGPSVRNGRPYTTVLDDSFSALSGFFTAFEVLPTLKNGFCYNRYNLGSISSLGGSQTGFASGTAMQIGKYDGSGPMSVQVSGIYRSKPFSRTIEIPNTSVDAADGCVQLMWSGSLLRALEATTVNNSIIRDIITTSMDNRVLSRYTAFLALETGDTLRTQTTDPNTNPAVFVPPPGLDTRVTAPNAGGLVSSVRTQSAAAIGLSAAPNPFSALSGGTTIRFTLPEGTRADMIEVEVYSLLGQKVRTFAAETLSQTGSQSGSQAANGALSLLWNGTDDNGGVLPAGAYTIVVKTPSQRFSLQVMLVRS